MRLRSVLRAIHLIGASVLGTFLYSPWSADPRFASVTRWAVFPALLAATGMILWQQARFKRLFGAKAVRS